VVYGTVWESEPLSELQTRSKAILDQFAVSWMWNDKLFLVVLLISSVTS